MIKRIFFLLSLVAFTGNCAYSQSVDNIIAKHNEVTGQDQLAKIGTYTIEATVSQMGMEIPMTMKMKRPDKFLMEMDLQGQKMIQAYNGHSGWALMPMMNNEPQELTGDQLEQAKQQAIIDGPFTDIEERGLTAELVGKEQKHGKEVFHIKLADPIGQSQSYFIDTESYYLVSTSRTLNTQGMEIEIESIMSDFQPTEGIPIARKIESVTPMGNATIKITEIQFNTPIDDSVFEKPGQK
jgi:outer membrane lipoprotein-sorting protein